MNKKNKHFAELLRGIADMIEKESVTIKDSNINMSAGHTSGVDPENYQFETHHPDGNYNINLHVDFYDAEKDKSNEAYDPMSDIRKEVGL